MQLSFYIITFTFLVHQIGSISLNSLNAGNALAEVALNSLMVAAMQAMNQDGDAATNEAEALIKMFDTNGDGSISLDEILKGFEDQLGRSL